MGQMFKKAKDAAPPAQGNGMNGAPPAPALGKTGNVACPQGTDNGKTGLKIKTQRVETGY